MAKVSGPIYEDLSRGQKWALRVLYSCLIVAVVLLGLVLYTLVGR